MKKVLSVVLAAIMILSMVVVSAAAAPEGTAIKTAAEFAAMAADGKYYLANDITLDATYGGGETVVPFTGTLDGNGKTITTTVAVFAEIDGATIKNLTLAGSVESTVSNVAVLANWATKAAAGDTVLENIVNNCTMTTTGGICGAFIGRLYGVEGTPSSLTIKNCVNNAKITASSHAGGFVGYKDDTTKKAAFTFAFIDCVNNGDIETTSTGKVGCAGFVASAAQATNESDILYTLTFTNCVNNGNIIAPSTGAAAYAGAAGFVGSAGCKITFTNCKNKGNVTTAGNHAAGFLGTTRYSWTSVEIVNCDNYGTITGTGKVGEFIGNTDKAVAEGSGFAYLIKNCYTVNTAAPLYGGTEDPSRVTIEGTPAAAPVYTEAVVTEPVVVTPPTTGDNSVWFAIIAIVAVIASAAVIVRRKEN